MAEELIAVTDPTSGFVEEATERIEYKDKWLDEVIIRSRPQKNTAGVLDGNAVNEKQYIRVTWRWYNKALHKFPRVSKPEEPLVITNFWPWAYARSTALAWMNDGLTLFDLEGQYRIKLAILALAQQEVSAVTAQRDGMAARLTVLPGDIQSAQDAVDALTDETSEEERAAAVAAVDSLTAEQTILQAALPDIETALTEAAARLAGVQGQLTTVQGQLGMGG